MPQHRVNSREPSTRVESSYHFSAPLERKALAATDFAETFSAGWVVRNCPHQNGEDEQRSLGKKKELLSHFKVHKQCVFGEQKANCLRASFPRRVGEVTHVLRLHRAFVH